jgi:hypothetical protein
MGWELQRRIWKSEHVKNKLALGECGVGVLVGKPKEAMSGVCGGGGGGQLLQLTKAHLGNEYVYVPG